MINADGLAEPRPIEVGPTYAKLTIVNSGLSGGERIVTDGQYKLQRNAPVTITSTASAGSGGSS
jgi:multidrug efflux system membrane fusion protein